MGLESTALLPDRVLCLVAGPGPHMSPEELVDAVDSAIQGGVNMVQLRDRVSTGQAKTGLASAVRGVTRDRAMFVVNGDPELAVQVGADGVHLPEAAMSVPEARQIAGPGVLIGRSVHSTEAAQSAAAEGADYVVAGTVYPSPTHPGGRASGTAIIRDIVSVVDLPTIGIGGIDASNAARVMYAGARGVACISAILAAEDPRLAAAEISIAINQQQPGGDTR